ncbi:MAG: hypothetical protein J6X94_04205 [Lachnospiraceae bacterium]|nr:hypothetical protein [Lachnospiraceae bacterium]
MIENRLRLFYYTKEDNKRKLMTALSEILLDDKYKDIDWYIKRDWRYGPNIGIYSYPKEGMKDLETEFYEAIKTRAMDFWKKTRSKVECPDEEVLKQLNQLETNGAESDDSFLPIEKNKTCKIDQVEEKHIDMFSVEEEYSLYRIKRCEVACLLLRTIRVLNGLDEADQYKMLVCIYAKLAECYPNAGLLNGCISFKSHITGFLANKDRRVGGIKLRFESIYDQMKPGLEELYSNDFVIDEQKELIEDWSVFFRSFIESIKYDEKIKKTIMKNGKFSEKSVQALLNYSDFHYKWVGRKSFTDFFYSDAFYKYRLSVNFFYLLLPTMGIGPIGKHLCCYLVTRLVEESNDIRLMDMIAEA